MGLNCVAKYVDTDTGAAWDVKVSMLKDTDRGIL